MTVSVHMDPAALYRKVMQEAAQRKVSEPLEDADLPADKAALRRSLRAKYARQRADFAAYLAQREAAEDAVKKAAG